ncbi:MAG: hydantoinase/oxoprolinase family protein, partial [Gammaproteobacteria bacterium]|nr:hydantoinase/oxoprolinase family protein [Gammaproteobacteria bacterium]
TVATNALLERKGAKVGLLTTEGHRDVIEMREGLKDDRYALRQPAPEPLVPRRLRLPVRERVRADGSIETALSRRSLSSALASFRDEGVDSVAVCYLHAYRVDDHERRSAAAIARVLPEAHVSLSCEVFPQIKEYERVCTTVVNAYVGPALQRYLTRLQARLVEAGYHGPLLIMQSHGGLATVRDAVALAAGAVLSGPAGGVAGSRHAGQLLDVADLIAFDMGGTSTDISLVVDGAASIAAGRPIAGQRLGLQSLDIVSIGAGGGSCALIDAGGVLHVGPQSAGADPGPACYGRGGTQATVTDANLVLGYLSPDASLAGGTRLDAGAAHAAVETVAGTLGLSTVDAAAGIHRLVNTRMADGIRLVSVRRGVDPRRFALLSFGGAAGAHITAVARELDLRRVIVPRLASVLSAWGMLASDLRYECVRTHIGDLGRFDAAQLQSVFAELEHDGRQKLAQANFHGEVRVQRSADMRYGEQIFEINVPLDDIDWRGADPLAEAVEAFHRQHESLYTYALRDQEVVLVNARVAVIGRLPALPAEPGRAAVRPAEPIARRRVHLQGWREVPVFELGALATRQRVVGPAIIDAATTTVLLRDHDTASCTEQGWLDIDIAAPQSG